MKYIKYLLLVLGVSVFLSCEDMGGGAGNATVGFGQETYEFMESEGLVRIPVVFTGEPKKYPIQFSIKAYVEDGTPLAEVADFVQILSSMRYNGKGDVVLEIELNDNFVENADRNLVLEITSADGAKIVNGRTAIVIKDNDQTLYESLQGKWTFSSILENGQKKMFEVTIDAGGSPSEIKENIEKKRLRIVGWEQWTETKDSPARPVAWYLDIRTKQENGENSWFWDGQEDYGLDNLFDAEILDRLDEEILWTVPDIPFFEETDGSPLKVNGKFCELRPLFLPVLENGELDKKNTFVRFEMPAVWSADRRKISFSTKQAIIAMIYQNNEPAGSYYNIHREVTLTR